MKCFGKAWYHEEREKKIMSQNLGCDERYQYIILQNCCKLTENLGLCCVVVTVVSGRA